MLISESALEQIIREEIMLLIQEIGRRGFLKGLLATGAAAAIPKTAQAASSNVTPLEALQHIRKTYSVTNEGQPATHKFANLIKMLQQKYNTKVNLAALSKHIVSGLGEIPILVRTFGARQVRAEYHRTGNMISDLDLRTLLSHFRSSKGTGAIMAKYENVFIILTGRKAKLDTYLHEFDHYIDDVIVPNFVRDVMNQTDFTSISDQYANEIKAMVYDSKTANLRATVASRFRTVDLEAIIQQSPEAGPFIKRMAMQPMASGKTRYEYYTDPAEFRSFMHEMFQIAPRNTEDVIDIINKNINHEHTARRGFAAILDPSKAKLILSFVNKLAAAPSKQTNQQTV